MKFKAFVGQREHDVEVDELDGHYDVRVDGERRRVDTLPLDGGFFSLIVDGISREVNVRRSEEGFTVGIGHDEHHVRLVDPLAAAAGAHLDDEGPVELRAVMPGRVVKTLVAEGDQVARGQGIIVLEAMKMENEVSAPRESRVTQLLVEAGSTLETGQIIAVLE